MFNMGMILSSIFVVSSFSTIYTLVLYYKADEKTCYVLDNEYYISTWTVTQRSLIFVWWYYPIIWLFWPPGLLKKNKTVLYQRPQSASEEIKDDADSYDDENDSESDLKSANSYVNFN